MALSSESQALGFIVAIAKDGDVPIGIGVMERLKRELPAEVCRENRLGRRIVEKQFPFCVRVIGRLGLYVQPEHRGKKVATNLLNAMEEIRRDELLNETSGWSPDDIATTVASGVAAQIAKAHSKFFRCIQTDKECQLRNREITHIVRGANEIRAGDPFPPIRVLPEWNQWMAPMPAPSDFAPLQNQSHHLDRRL